MSVKILISANSSWNIFNFRLDLIKSLLRNNYKVVILTPLEDNYSKKLVNLGCIHYHISLNRKSLSPLKDFILILQYKRIMKKLSPDVFLGFTIKPNIYGSIAANINRVPVINNLSGLGTVFIKGGLLKIFVIFAYKIALRKSLIILFQNIDDRNLFTSKRIVNLNKTKIINGSGIDLNYYKFSPIKKHNKYSIKFIYAGRLLWDKGIGELVSSIIIIKKKYPLVRFQFVGILDINNLSHISKKQIEKWVDEKIIEYIDQKDDIRDYIKEADCAILPSYREGLPRFLLEAASIGRPIICTDVPGCRQVVKDKYNGLLCLPRDVESLSSSIEEFINLSYEEIKKMGINGRKVVENYFDQKIVNSLYLKIINKIKK